MIRQEAGITVCFVDSLDEMDVDSSSFKEKWETLTKKKTSIETVCFCWENVVYNK